MCLVQGNLWRNIKTRSPWQLCNWKSRSLLTFAIQSRAFDKHSHVKSNQSNYRADKEKMFLLWSRLKLHKAITRSYFPLICISIGLFTVCVFCFERACQQQVAVAFIRITAVIVQTWKQSAVLRGWRWMRLKGMKR